MAVLMNALNYSYSSCTHNMVIGLKQIGWYHNNKKIIIPLSNEPVIVGKEKFECLLDYEFLLGKHAHFKRIKREWYVKSIGTIFIDSEELMFDEQRKLELDNVINFGSSKIYETFTCIFGKINIEDGMVIRVTVGNTIYFERFMKDGMIDCLEQSTQVSEKEIEVITINDEEEKQNQDKAGLATGDEDNRGNKDDEETSEKQNNVNDEKDNQDSVDLVFDNEGGREIPVNVDLNSSTFGSYSPLNSNQITYSWVPKEQIYPGYQSLSPVQEEGNSVRNEGEVYWSIIESSESVIKMKAKRGEINRCIIESSSESEVDELEIDCSQESDSGTSDSDTSIQFQRKRRRLNRPLIESSSESDVEDKEIDCLQESNSGTSDSDTSIQTQRKRRRVNRSLVESSSESDVEEMEIDCSQESDNGTSDRDTSIQSQRKRRRVERPLRKSSNGSDINETEIDCSLEYDGRISDIHSYTQSEEKRQEANRIESSNGSDIDEMEMDCSQEYDGRISDIHSYTQSEEKRQGVNRIESSNGSDIDETEIEYDSRISDTDTCTVSQANISVPSQDIFKSTVEEDMELEWYIASFCKSKHEPRRTILIDPLPMKKRSYKCPTSTQRPANYNSRMNTQLTQEVNIKPVRRNSVTMNNKSAQRPGSIVRRDSKSGKEKSGRLDSSS